jgi:hypothetical protein
MSANDFKSALGKRKSRLGALQAQLKKESKAASFEDTRFWKLEHQDGNGNAIIRFLPEAKGEDAPWVKYHRHEFKGQGGWVMDNCPTSIGEKCPICEANSLLWNEGGDDNEKLARDRKRKLKYVSNILVITDPANPENEGKIFLYQYGKMIFDMIDAKINPPEPEFKGEVQKEAVDVFDFFDGCNFRLRMKKKGGGYPTYESSEFDMSSPLAETEEEMEQIWNSQYALTEFSSPEFFKSYDELNERFQKVVTGNSAPSKPIETVEEHIVSQPKQKKQPDFVAKSDRVTTPEPIATVNDDDDEMAFFNKLAEE